MDQASPEVVEEMRAWASGVGYHSLCGDEVVEPHEMTDMELMRLVDEQYPGGTDAFDRRDDDHIDMAPHGQWT